MPNCRAFGGSLRAPHHCPYPAHHSMHRPPRMMAILADGKLDFGCGSAIIFYPTLIPPIPHNSDDQPAAASRVYNC